MKNIKDEEVEEMKYEVNEETRNAVMEAEEEYWKIMADLVTRRLAELRGKAIRDEVTNINGTKRKIARKLKKEKVDIEIIIKTIGLTKEEMERL